MKELLRYFFLAANPIYWIVIVYMTDTDTYRLLFALLLVFGLGAQFWIMTILLPNRTELSYPASTTGEEFDGTKAEHYNLK